MARNRITQAGKQLTNDDGSVLQSLISGEQVRSTVTLNWFTNLDGAQIAVRLVEADNNSLQYSNGTPSSYPTTVKSGAEVKYLPIRYQYGRTQDSDSDALYRTVDTDQLITFDYNEGFTSNTFEIVWDDAFSTDFEPQPRPDKPVYAFVSMEVRDTGSGEDQQVWKPLRGLIEVRYGVSISI